MTKSCPPQDRGTSREWVLRTAWNKTNIHSVSGPDNGTGNTVDSWIQISSVYRGHLHSLDSWLPVIYVNNRYMPDHDPPPRKCFVFNLNPIFFWWGGGVLVGLLSFYLQRSNMTSSDKIGTKCQARTSEWVTPAKSAISDLQVLKLHQGEVMNS